MEADFFEGVKNIYGLTVRYGIGISLLLCYYESTATQRAVEAIII